MTIEKAMAIMRANRGMLSGQSVLNPQITALDAWELIWRELVKLSGLHPSSTKLSAWLSKRVRQVCSNRLNPELPDLTLPPMGRKITEPKPEPYFGEMPKKPLLMMLSAPAVVSTHQAAPAPAVEITPAAPKPKPFSRKFS